MGDPKAGGYRAWLGLELPDSASTALQTWFEKLDHESVAIPEASGRIIVVSALAGRSSAQLGRLVARIRELEPPPVSVHFAKEVQGLPSRQFPRLLQLPCSCSGLTLLLEMVAADLPPGNDHVVAGKGRPFLPVGRVRTGAGSPRCWPPTLPGDLLEPVDAVRFGLYCSQTTPERFGLDSLARVKLPVAAAVR